MQIKYFLKAYPLGHTLAAPLSYWGSLDIYLRRAAFAIPVIFIYFVFCLHFDISLFLPPPLQSQVTPAGAQYNGLGGGEGARCVLNKYFMEIVELV